jgi:ABC-type multidrug transport system permease subunit
MKFLSPRIHGYLDYVVVAALLLAPSIFGFGGIAAGLCYVLAVAQLGMSLLTAYPLGALKLLPFTIHGFVEAATAVLLVAAPWLFGFADVPEARNFFLASGVVLGVVWLVTDYKAAQLPSDRAGIRLPRERHV